MNNFSEKVSFIWSVADLLRGDYKQSEYGRVILPFTVLRRLDQVLGTTRDAVWHAAEAHANKPESIRHQMLLRASRQSFYNTSKLDFATLLRDDKHVAQNVAGYVAGFSKNARDIMERFRFEAQVERLDRANLLYLVVQKFNAIDLHPDRVGNHEMGTIFEELIRKFAESSNETAGEHFTPREVIRLMVNLLFAEDDDALRKPGIVRTMYDPACGTGGMLSVAEEHLGSMNPGARLQVFGQELNPESYAICKADMLIKGQDADSIKIGNSFSADGLPDLHVDYLISNPPFGVDWSKAKADVDREHKRGHAGRFGPGLPRKNDGSLLFLLHMWSKRRSPDQGGSRLAIVFNGSPLFTGSAASGESEIRRWVIENDWLEAIVGLPDQMFYNTGINTYVWVLSNRKARHRKGKVQLINAVDKYQKMRRSLGDKRKELSNDHIAEVTRLYHEFREVDGLSRIFDNEDFGFHRITVERPLRLNFHASEERVARLEDESAWQKLVQSKKKDAEAKAAEVAQGEAVQASVRRVLARLDPDRLHRSRASVTKDLKAAARAEPVKLPGPLLKAIRSALGERDEDAEVCNDSKGNPEPDTGLRDYENVPLKEDIGEHMEREVLPHVPDAWVDESKTKVGYEIPFTRHFYVYTPPRPLEVIEGEIRALEQEIQGMLAEVLA